MTRHRPRYLALFTGIGMLATAGTAWGQPGGNPALFSASWRAFTTGRFPDFAPIAMAPADLDGDTDIDAVIAHEFFSGPGLVVMSNQGDGTFVATSRYDLPYIESIADVALADIDRDGRLDAIATVPDANAQSSKAYWWHGNGDATFSAARRVFSTGPGPIGLAVGDFTGDGFPDVVTANGAFFGTGNTISLMKHNGLAGAGAGFLAPVTTVVGANVQRVVAANLDGDTDLDLAVGRADISGNAILLNNGDGTFAAPTLYPHATGQFQPGAAIALTDVDRDGDSDLVASATTSRGVVSVRRNNGAGVFGAVTVYSLMEWSWTLSSISAGDLNGDGWVDLIGTTPSGRAVDGFHVLLNDRAGGYLTSVYYRASKQTVDAEAFDADGDGDREIVTVANDSAVITVHDNPGNGTFAGPPEYPVGTLSNDMAQGDIDRDSAVDLVTIDSDALILRNNGDGTFAAAAPYNTPINPGTVQLPDMNNDGFPDLLLGPDSNAPPYHFAVGLNRGDGTFAAGVVTFVNASQAGELVATDLNNDGFLDVVITDPGPASAIYVFRSNHTGTSFTYVQGFDGIGPNGIDSADFNHDAFADLISSTALGVTVWPGNGNFTFDPIITQGDYAYRFAITDFNADGNHDLAILIPQDSFGTVQVSTMLGYGDGDFGFPTTYDGPSGRESAFRISSNVDAVDVDGDGFGDLILTSNAPGDVAVFRGNNDGTLQPMDRYGAGYSAHSSAFADFTGDEVMDIATIVSLPPGGFADVVVVLVGRSTGGGGELTLAVSGPCPGTVTLTATNATPNGPVAFAYAFGTGSVTIPSGPCAGTVLGLNGSATLLRTVRADASGTATVAGSAPPGACGRVVLQAIDGSTCRTSNVEGL